MQNVGDMNAAQLQPVGFVVDYDSRMVGIQQIIGQFGGWLMGQAGMRGYLPNDMLELYPLLTETHGTSLEKLRQIKMQLSDDVTFTGKSFEDICGLRFVDELMDRALTNNDENDAGQAIDAMLGAISPKLEEAYVRFCKLEGYRSFR